MLFAQFESGLSNEEEWPPVLIENYYYVEYHSCIVTYLPYTFPYHSSTD